MLPVARRRSYPRCHTRFNSAVAAKNPSADAPLNCVVSDAASFGPGAARLLRLVEVDAPQLSNTARVEEQEFFEREAACCVDQ